MVSKSPNQHKTVKTNIVLLVSLLFVFVFAGALISCYIIKGINDNTSPDPDASIHEAEPEPEPEPEPVLPPAISFQTVIDNWANYVGGSKSVIIYDLDRDEIAGESNPDESYNTASLYKLFVVYDGYRKVQSGEWQSDSPAGNTGYSIIECLDLAIRESNSSCAETLWSMIGRYDLATIVTDDYHITDSDISSLISNAPASSTKKPAPTSWPVQTRKTWSLEDDADILQTRRNHQRGINCKDEGFFLGAANYYL